MVKQPINETELTLRSLLASGGSADIYDIQGYDGRLVYKRYISERPVAPILELIEIAERASEADREYINEHFAWPVDGVVNDDGVLSGVLIPGSPTEYIAHLTTGADRVRDLNYLLYEKRSARVGIAPVSIKDKLKVIRGLAGAFAFLQKQGLVHEDPSGQNVLWTVESEPGVYILDCDSIREEAVHLTDPLITTVNWTDPRVLSGEIERPDFQSNSYMLGLATVRIFGSPSWGSSSISGTRIPELPIPPQLQRLAAQSLTTRRSRPSVNEWLNELNQAIDSASLDAPPPAPPVKPQDKPRVGGLSWQAKERIGIAIGFLAGAILALLLVVFVI
jgi:hypothetical protein